RARGPPADPDRDALLHGRGVDREAREVVRRPVILRLALPERRLDRADRVARERAAAREIAPEEPELLLERPDPDAEDQAPAADRVERPVALHDLERVVVAEHEDVGREPDAPGDRGDVPERHRRIPVAPAAPRRRRSRDRDVVRRRQVEVAQAIGGARDRGELVDRRIALPLVHDARVRDDDGRDDAVAHVLLPHEARSWRTMSGFRAAESAVAAVMRPRRTRSASDESRLIMPSARPVWMRSAIWWPRASRIACAIACVTIMRSVAGTSPPGSTAGSRTWTTIARSAPASWWRTCACWCGGKESRMRSIAIGALPEWSVEKTRCPVSAAVKAAANVSRSRISPTRMTSGLSRSAARRPAAKLSTSRPTSRWWIRQRSLSYSNSTGSSMVTMCREARWFR